MVYMSASPSGSPFPDFLYTFVRTCKTVTVHVPAQRDTDIHISPHLSTDSNLLSQYMKDISFLVMQVIFICVYITNYLHFISVFLSF